MQLSILGNFKIEKINISGLFVIGIVNVFQ